MGIDYDAWLTEPYERQAANADLYDYMAERYLDSDEFDADMAEWAKAKGLTEYDWQDYFGTDECEAVVERMVEDYKYGDR